MSIKTNARFIITGASSGIGRALALKLAKKYRARLVLCARSEGDLAATKKQIEDDYAGRATIVKADLALSRDGGDDDIQKRLVEIAQNEYGGLDGIVNNAGMGSPGAFTALSIKDWRRLFEVNFFGALKLIQYALPAMDATEGSARKIVNISSVAGKVAIPGSVSYCASKFALTALSEGIAAELHSKGVDVLTVCPGWVRTEFFEKNHVPDIKNPTLMAQGNDVKGFLMKNILSISTEQCVNDIMHALDAGGSKELIQTLPGKVVERLHGVAPNLVRRLVRMVPTNL